ncbi:DNA glycosylase AlkZ-like family protein [Streptomyces sp. NPDC047706]|uniref:DNA glycosylase AlkZ-like family protein n=1 Tax=Streptomyces sp. NPDC047706 TaxID=3365486 RepID=UPI00371539B7
MRPARDRELRIFRTGLAGVDLERLACLARELVEAGPRTMRQLREALGAEWPDADPQALAVAARCTLPLVQVTPRGVWGRSAQVSLTTAEHWLGRPAEPAATAESAVLRYLGAFGPACVKDMQTRSGLTRMRPVFDGLRPRRSPSGTSAAPSSSTSRTPPAPTLTPPPRFLPEFDNLLLSHADRTRVVPPAQHGRTWQVNTFHCPLLVDGFLAGVWRLLDGALVVEPFGGLTRAQRDEVTEEGRRVLQVLHQGASYDIRCGTVLP